jgi:hypothetical protein
MMPYRLNEQGDMVWEDDSLQPPTVPDTYEQRWLARQPLSAIDPKQAKKPAGDSFGEAIFRLLSGGKPSQMYKDEQQKKLDEKNADELRYNTENLAASNLVTQRDNEIKFAHEKKKKTDLDLAKSIALQLAGRLPENSEYGKNSAEATADETMAMNPGAMASGPSTLTQPAAAQQRTQQYMDMGVSPVSSYEQTESDFAPPKPEKEPKQPKPTIDEMKFEASGQWDDWKQQHGGNGLKAWDSLDQGDKRYLRHRINVDVRRDYEIEGRKAALELKRRVKQWEADKKRYFDKTTSGKMNDQDLLEYDYAAYAAAKGTQPTMKDVVADASSDYPLLLMNDFGGMIDLPKPETGEQTPKGTSGQGVPQGVPGIGTPAGYVSPEQEAAINKRIEAAEARLKSLKAGFK